MSQQIEQSEQESLNEIECELSQQSEDNTEVDLHSYQESMKNYLKLNVDEIKRTFEVKNKKIQKKKSQV